MNGSSEDSNSNGLPLHYIRNPDQQQQEDPSTSAIPLSGVQVSTPSGSSALSARARRPPAASMPADQDGSSPPYAYDPDDEKKKEVYGTIDDDRTLANTTNLSAAAFGSLGQGGPPGAGPSSSKPNKWESLVPDSKRRTGKSASIAQAVVRPSRLPILVLHVHALIITTLGYVSCFQSFAVGVRAGQQRFRSFDWIHRSLSFHKAVEDREGRHRRLG